MRRRLRRVLARAIAARGSSKAPGGTTAKICLIEKYQPETSRVFEVDRAARFLKGSGLPVRIPVIEMVEIGAGGGSIARVDALKRVTVGPESASSEPGPACYGRGGQRPAVTDADVALGKIDPDAFAGGTIKLSPELSKQALLRDIGEPLGLSAETSAYAVHEVVCENMASAARVHAVERGAVVGQHTLIAFGGAAPLHAARVAEKIGVSRVIVPSNAGVGSAVGFLAAPIAYELVRSRHARLDAFDVKAVSDLLDEMATEARALVEPGAAGAPVRERRAAFMRYVGQGHEIGSGSCGFAPGLRDGLCGLVRATDSGRCDRGAELVGARDHRAAQSVARCRGDAQTGRKSRWQPQVFRWPCREGRRDSAVSPRPDGAGGDHRGTRRDRGR